MTLEQLKMMVTVADLGSLKAASEKLFKTQPAVSQGISKLERQLNVTLFDRHSYRLSLTEEGKQLYQHAKRVLAEESILREVAQHFQQGHEAKVTIAFEASLDLRLLLPVLEATQRDFPATQLILRQEFMSGAMQAVINRTADIAITPIGSGMINMNDFHSLPLFSGRFVRVASKKLIDRHDVLKSVDQLRDEYQIVVQDSGTAFANREVDVQKGQRKWYVNDFGTKLTIIKSGIGWGKLPSHLVTPLLESGELQNLLLDDTASDSALQYFAIMQRDQVLGPVGKSLWQAFEALKQH